MNSNVQAVIDTAKSQVGYLEKETWSNLDDPIANAGDENYVKYSRDQAKLNYFNSSKKGIAWCSVFVAWVFVSVFGKDEAQRLLCQPRTDNCGAGCNSARSYFKRKGQLMDDPQPGDVIYFWNSEMKEASHTGIVVAVDSRYVYTVEGNTSSSSGVIDNGGAVAEKKYELSDKRIAGYGRPDYDTEHTENTSKEETTVTTGKAWVRVEHGTTVNFRQKPSTTASKVRGMNTIKSGEEVLITDGDQTWAAVSYKGYNGYVMLKYLTQDEPQNEPQIDIPEQTASADELVSKIMTLVRELAALAK